MDMPHQAWREIAFDMYFIDLSFNVFQCIQTIKNQSLYVKQLRYYKYSNHDIKKDILNNTFPMYFEGTVIHLYEAISFSISRKYTCDIYNFFHQAPIFILLFHGTIPYSLKEIWEDFQESGNYHRKPRIDQEFRSNCSNPDILFRYL